MDRIYCCVLETLKYKWLDETRVFSGKMEFFNASSGAGLRDATFPEDLKVLMKVGIRARRKYGIDVCC